MWNSSISNGFVIPCLIHVLKYSNLKTCKNRTVSLDAQIPVTFLLLFLVSNDGLVQNIMRIFFFYLKLQWNAVRSLIVYLLGVNCSKISLAFTITKEIVLFQNILMNVSLKIVMLCIFKFLISVQLVTSELKFVCIMLVWLSRAFLML